ncbi:Gustatory and odorant receptor 63a [Frankliniella fusca]|uniref:Gustatory and odorant receptor 63a n=1 Tax=Frankliniella fusca TaxID=407009 RepID=A0AAE1LS44_9NEOP|nr:Gustatory and odorant receptor 63a [Frankliniella fusca]
MTLAATPAPAASKPCATTPAPEDQDPAPAGSMAADTLFHEVAPLRAALFLLALWPISSGERGRARAAALSHSTCYTVLVFAVWSVFNARAVAARWAAFADGPGAGAGAGGASASDFNTRIVNLIVLALLAHHWLLPATVWPEAAALAKYFNDWIAFQHVVAQAGEQPVQAAALFPPLCFFFLVGGVWSTLCSAIEASARRLQHAFRAERERVVAVRRVRAYGLLWLRLRSLAARTGAAQSGALLVYTVYSMALALTAAIGVLVALLHADLGPANAVQALFLVENLHHIYTVHDAGHRAAQAAANALRYDMLCIRPAATDGSEMDTEVRTLIMATDMHHAADRGASVISLGGFAACSRSSMIEVALETEGPRPRLQKALKPFAAVQFENSIRKSLQVYNMLLINLLVLLQFAYFVY